MFVYAKKERAQLMADRYNDRDHTKDWAGRDQVDNGKRAFVKPCKYGFTIEFK